MSAALPPPRRSAWIPWVFVAAMLAVVAVNGVLVFFALSTFPGVTTPRAYERGRAYNEVLAEASRQEALGWSIAIALQDGVLRVSGTDREGLPLAGRVAGVLLRPLEGTEQPLDFAAVSPGVWIAATGALRPGQWDARVRLTAPDGARRDATRRLVAP